MDNKCYFEVHGDCDCSSLRQQLAKGKPAVLKADYATPVPRPAADREDSAPTQSARPYVRSPHQIPADATDSRSRSRRRSRKAVR